MTKKISELTAVSAALAADQIEVNESGTSKRSTLQQVADLFQSIWTSLQFGGTSASFPMLKRSTTKLQAKLADDSAFTEVQLASLLFGSPASRTPKFVTYEATVTVTAAATTGKEATIISDGYYALTMVDECATLDNGLMIRKSSQLRAI